MPWTQIKLELLRELIPRTWLRKMCPSEIQPNSIHGDLSCSRLESDVANFHLAVLLGDIQAPPTHAEWAMLLLSHLSRNLDANLETCALTRTSAPHHMAVRDLPVIRQLVAHGFPHSIQHCSCKTQDSHPWKAWWPSSLANYPLARTSTQLQYDEVLLSRRLVLLQTMSMANSDLSREPNAIERAQPQSELPTDFPTTTSHEKLATRFRLLSLISISCGPTIFFQNNFTSCDPHHDLYRLVTGKSSGFLSDISSGIRSGILSSISSGILSSISSGICSDIFSGILSGISSNILSGILSGKSYGIVSGKHSGPLSRIPSGILSEISSSILPTWHIFLHMYWHIFWHIFWHSI